MACTRSVTLVAATAALVAGVGTPARPAIIELSIEAGPFASGRAGAVETGEIPPVDFVVASFTIDTEAARDVPDRIVLASNGDGPTYEVHNRWMSPAAGDIEIDGYAYPLEDLAAYVGDVDGKLAQILVSGRQIGVEPPLCGFVGDPEPLPSCHPAHFTTGGTDDFMVSLILPSPAEGEHVAFHYTTADTVGSFGALALRLTLVVDGGEPIEVTKLRPSAPVEGAVACEAARAAGAALEGEAKPGTLLCDVTLEEVLQAVGQRAASAAPAVLRDARVRRTPASAAGLGRGMRVRTALGTHRLDARKIDRLLLAAAASASSDVAAPGGAAQDALRCAKVAKARGAARFRGVRNVFATDAEGRLARYHVKRPRRLCVGPDGLGDPGSLLCYRAKRLGKTRAHARLWVAHALGTEQVAVKRAKELCVPVERAE